MEASVSARSPAMDAGCTNLKFEITRIATDVNHIVVVGKYALDMLNADKKKTSDRGKLICIHLRQSNEIVYDIWNTDLPLEL